VLNWTANHEGISRSGVRFHTFLTMAQYENEWSA